MCDVRLGVKFPLGVNLAFDFPGPDSFDDGRHAREEIIGLLFLFNAAVEDGFRSFAKPFEKRLAGSCRHFLAQQNPNLVELLPARLQRQERADFEEARRDVERAGDLGPIVEVFQPLPEIVAVIDDE